MTRLITLTPQKTPHRENTHEKVPHIDPLGRGSEMNTCDKRDEGQVLGRDTKGQVLLARYHGDGYLARPFEYNTSSWPIGIVDECRILA